jgi:hypothetical protein
MAEYTGQHEAPGYDPQQSSAPMHDISSLIPDYYERSHEYRLTHEPTEHTAMEHIDLSRNRPKRQVRVFRAIPADVPIKRGKGINTGDWVTPVRAYAVEHGRSHLSNQFKIVSKTVPAKHLYTEGNSWEEWGYDPSR